RQFVPTESPSVVFYHVRRDNFRRTMSLRGIHARLTFLGEVQGTPTNYFEVEPPPGVPRLYPRVEHEVEIRDARPLAGALSLDREGFMLAHHPAGARADWLDQPALRAEVYPVMAELVRALTGAGRVLVFDHTHRSSALSQRTEGFDVAVNEVHNDYTVRSGPRRVRELV